MCTGTKRSKRALICSMTISVPEVTIVIREYPLTESISDTVKLSMLYPLPAKRPMTLANTPGSLSTKTAIVCLRSELGFCELNTLLLLTD